MTASLLFVALVGAAPPAPASVAPRPLDVVDEGPSILRPTDGGLTAARVAERALIDAPDVQLRIAELEAAAARVDQARASYVPAIDLTAQYMRLSPLPGGSSSGALVGTLNPGPLAVGACPDGTTGCVVDAQGVPALAQSFQFAAIENTYALTAAVGVPLSDDLFTIPHAVEAAQHGERAASLARDIQRIDTIVDAQIAYYNWVRAQANLELARRSSTRVAQRIGEAQARLRAGAITETDVLRLQAQLATAQRVVAQSEAFVDIAAEDLGSRIALDPLSLDLGEDLTATFAADRKREAPPQLVEQALARRRELTLLRESDAALREQIKVSRTRYAPRLDLVGQVDTANPNQRVVPQREQFDTTWAVGLRLSYDVRGAISTRSRIQEQRAQRRAVTAQVAQLQRGVRLQVVQAAKQLEAARRSVKLSAVGQRSAEAAYDQISARYRAGAVGVVDVMEAESLRVEAELRAIDARIAVREHDLRLRHALGEVEPG
ncbi:MAG: TolC family protein [Myxococcota bacterium]